MDSCAHVHAHTHTLQTQAQCWDLVLCTQQCHSACVRWFELKQLLSSVLPSVLSADTGTSSLLSTPFPPWTPFLHHVATAALPTGIDGPEDDLHWLSCYQPSTHSTAGRGWKWILIRTLHLYVREGQQAKNGGRMSSTNWHPPEW